MKSSRIFLIGTGVGRDLRGFESHIRDLFEKVKSEANYESFIVKGAGLTGNHEILVPSLSRKSRLSKFIGILFNRNPYIIQQLSFFLGLIPVLYRFKPNALYLGEPALFNYLYRWRNFSGMNFKMTFYTGGNTVPIKMQSDDFLQLVTPVLIPLAKQRGVAENQMKVIPHFINSIEMTESLSKRDLRIKLNIPDNRLIILSVGAIDSSIKRMDYLIDEVGNLSRPYFLIILGEYENESSEIIKLAEQKFGKDNFYIDKVERNKLSEYYRASDIFVLASLNEGFGLVTIEAMSHGLPVIVHPYAAAKYVLDEMAFYSDLSLKGNLTQLIETIIPQIDDSNAIEVRKKYTIDRFSWNSLAEDYRQMLNDATNSSTNQEVIS